MKQKILTIFRNKLLHEWLDAVFWRAWESTHNSKGLKEKSKYQIKGVGRRVFDVDIPRTDWVGWFVSKGLYDQIMRVKKDYPNYKRFILLKMD